MFQDNISTDVYPVPIWIDLPERLIAENAEGTRIKIEGAQTTHHVVCVNGRWICSCPTFQARHLIRSCAHTDVARDDAVLRKIKAGYRQGKTIIVLGDLRD
jgi:hypothetical protein